MTEDVIQWLNPKIDFVFKSLFCHPGNHQALTVFVNALLEAKGLQPLTTLRIVNPAIDRKQIEDKSIVLDLLGVTETGEPVDLEMMSVYFRSTPDRALYYMSRLFSEQMQRGQK
jgi:predicted transposase/invertase (TIGR01784 family)